MGVFEEQAKGKSDWTDQDLLTYAEAEERLVAQQAELEATVAAGGTDEVRRRLEQVTTLLETFRARRGASGGAS
ncbi:hypothetical protein VSH64_10725 [Amycolatopsis rhabdoformis]|uniref:Uncharacterized protein n=1 Tax=Amycolatopsis rhabdoformis TaxID=1448059 RepID=A0ABZ1IDN8_9PSEU|nr:hypothetical protein [Amycolatopsis rhabdoformis]WSE32579.1 hypothetical protein VSH64_10725 [Amycolatopsis rhabdoformis]